jgi:VWFA-related protein
VIQPPSISTLLARCALILSLTAAAAFAQTQTTPPPSPPVAPAPPIDPNAPETATKEEPAVFQTRVNLVMVPVVVRDAKGAAVGTLSKADFQLFDKGKPQEISKFSVEKPGAQGSKAAQTASVPPVAGDDTPAPPDIPERFVAYVFDDLHLQFGDLVRARDAAAKQLAALPKTDRAAIYTTSGQDQVDFTDDLDKLHETLLRLRVRSIADPGGMPQCPDIGYYMADQMVNKDDSNAITLAAQEFLACSGATGMTLAQAQSAVQGMAMGALHTGEQETRVTLAVLKDIVRRMSGMPGQRIVMLISPGFLASEQVSEKNDVIDRAIHSNVIISAMDARGLWVDPLTDASQRSTSTVSFLIQKQMFDRQAASAQADVLAEMAMGTGGAFFQNNNDLNEGLRRLAAAPEYYYVLGFSPQNLKLDGAFHGLKVTVKPLTGMAIQARKGYYAPKKLSNAAETAKEEIEEALFSREEMSELPVELNTRYFKGDKDATLTVLCHIDPKHVRFRKADGRNINSLTIVSGLFDRNGNFVSGIEKILELKLKDETLAKLAVAGRLSVKTDFSVAPGTYMVRLVVRDAEGQLMSAVNGAVQIQ